ncbi:pantothenate kinase [Gregarina niphandrodes]|uniref:Pantothenate kinase n=1 Tax=Gregarina niphandrodes TaxID=110365 RepID=A0A023BC61_GRENI|nr:pantothenate kinase [Gregarina niphandrodes]EZG82236.1 pantothenate kinase [Gregarina niphandrodes]|eukprot:XP_011129017.1 pantothenate kinase [Gregarina niphandrodes]
MSVVYPSCVRACPFCICAYLYGCLVLPNDIPAFICVRLHIVVQGIEYTGYYAKITNQKFITRVSTMGSEAKNFEQLLKTRLHVYNEVERLALGYPTLEAEVIKRKELQCVREALEFFSQHLGSCIYRYEQTTRFITDSSGSGRDAASSVKYVTQPAANGFELYPYLLVNMKAGVSFHEVTKQGMRRVGGSTIGLATFLGLSQQFCGAGTSAYDSFLQSDLGDQTTVDMLVSDIYGGDYSTIGLSGSMVASTMGKMQHIKPKKPPAERRPSSPSSAVKPFPSFTLEGEGSPRLLPLSRGSCHAPSDFFEALHVSAATETIDDRLPGNTSGTTSSGVERATNRFPEERLSGGRLSGGRLYGERLPEDRLPEDRLPEDRLPEDRLPEDRLPIEFTANVEGSTTSDQAVVGSEVDGESELSYLVNCSSDLESPSLQLRSPFSESFSPGAKQPAAVSTASVDDCGYSEPPHRPGSHVDTPVHDYLGSVDCASSTLTERAHAVHRGNHSHLGGDHPDSGGEQDRGLAHLGEYPHSHSEHYPAACIDLLDSDPTKVPPPRQLGKEVELDGVKVVSILESDSAASYVFTNRLVNERGTVAPAADRRPKECEADQTVHKADVYKSLLSMTSFNVAQLAYLNARIHNCKRIVMIGYYVDMPETLAAVQHCIQFWSQGEIQIYFVRVAPYLGAIGAALSEARRHVSGQTV